jgi:hypothetical protein
MIDESANESHPHTEQSKEYVEPESKEYVDGIEGEDVEPGA